MGSCMQNITHLSSTLLMQVLKLYQSQLPLSPKTLLKTSSRLCNLLKRFNPDDPTDLAEIFYYGIARNLQKIIHVALHQKKIIKLQFNMDGLPLF